MKGKNHSPEQIVRLLVQAEAQIVAGTSVQEVCRALQINPGTFSRWRYRYGGMKVQDIKRLKDLEKENVRLKKVVAELTLDKEILKEALEGK